MFEFNSTSICGFKQNYISLFAPVIWHICLVLNCEVISTIRIIPFSSSNTVYFIKFIIIKFIIIKWLYIIISLLKSKKCLEGNAEKNWRRNYIFRVALCPLNCTTLYRQRFFPQSDRKLFQFQQRLTKKYIRIWFLFTHKDLRKNDLYFIYLIYIYMFLINFIINYKFVFCVFKSKCVYFIEVSFP